MKMADTERKYIVPLRKGWVNTQRYRRTPKAMTVLQEFLQKHMKVKTVLIMKELNEFLHEKGRRNPPHKVEVHVKTIKEKDQTYAVANLVNAPLDVKKKEEKKKSVADKLKETVKKDSKSEEKAEKKEVLEHVPAPEHKEHEAGKMPVKGSPSPKAEKIVPQSGKK